MPVSVRLKSTGNSRSRRARELYTKQKNNYFRIGISALMAFYVTMQLSWIGAAQQQQGVGVQNS